MKQTLFGNVSFLFLCVMPLFLESVRVFQAADDSHCVDGRTGGQGPGPVGCCV